MTGKSSLPTSQLEVSGDLTVMVKPGKAIHAYLQMNTVIDGVVIPDVILRSYRDESAMLRDLAPEMELTVDTATGTIPKCKVISVSEVTTRPIDVATKLQQMRKQPSLPIVGG